MEYLQLVLPLVVVILILTVLCAALSCYIIRSRKNRQQMLDYSDAFNTRRISWSAPKRFENIAPESGIEAFEGNDVIPNPTVSYIEPEEATSYRNWNVQADCAPYRLAWLSPPTEEEMDREATPPTYYESESLRGSPPRNVQRVPKEHQTPLPFPNLSSTPQIAPPHSNHASPGFLNEVCASEPRMTRYSTSDGCDWLLPSYDFKRRSLPVNSIPFMQYCFRRRNNEGPPPYEESLVNYTKNLLASVNYTEMIDREAVEKSPSSEVMDCTIRYLSSFQDETPALPDILGETPLPSFEQSVTSNILEQTPQSYVPNYPIPANSGISSAPVNMLGTPMRTANVVPRQVNSPGGPGIGPSSASSVVQSSLSMQWDYGDAFLPDGATQHWI